MNIPKKILLNYTNVNRTVFKRFDLIGGKYTYHYLLEKIDLQFFSHFKEGHDQLTILLPGAVNRAKTLYNFQRYSWSDDIIGSVISFLDPTVDENNNITIGWFQGNSETYAIPVLVSLIKRILCANNIKESNVTIFGSSAGGFSSLKIANEFPNSRIIVVNPQTRIYNYFYKEYKKLASWIFPQVRTKDVKDIYKDRLRISLKLEQRSQPILYYQNIYDEHHLRYHLKPMLKYLDKEQYIETNGLFEKLEKKSQLQVIYYSDPHSGHSPLSKIDTIRILSTGAVIS